MSAMDRNHWPDDRCAKAFWDQHKALPYQQLLQDTAARVDPRPGERWLDLGCGSGQLTRVLWEKSGGGLGQIVSMDCAAANEDAIARLRSRYQPPVDAERIRFAVGNFSDGLPQFNSAHFDGIVSGLAISYAEYRDPTTGRFTDHAYNRLLEEMFRVLRPGGRLVFSVNVPDPAFGKIFWKSLRGAFRITKPAKTLINALRMMRYGGWLKREAARGRFHYLPLPEIERRLRHVGFAEVDGGLSYAGQAYVIRAGKRAAALPEVA
jgi:ubiquinone/menaquinone biosynthesis C-methylase UbiE